MMQKIPKLSRKTLLLIGQICESIYCLGIVMCMYIILLHLICVSISVCVCV